MYKFRGKRLDNGEWIEGNLIIHKDKCYIQPFNNFVAGIVGYVEVDPASVGQYTQLNDKNGREIYEGDILLSGYLRKKYVVEFTDGRFIGISESRKGSLEALESAEVIGNVFDNPDLLKAELTDSEVEKIIAETPAMPISPELDKRIRKVIDDNCVKVGGQ